jgi:hypothetical protein
VVSGRSVRPRFDAAGAESPISRPGGSRKCPSAYVSAIELGRMPAAPYDRAPPFTRESLDLVRRGLCALAASPDPAFPRPVNTHRISHLLRAAVSRDVVGDALERLEVLTESIRLPYGYWLPAPLRCVDAYGVLLVLAPLSTSDLGNAIGEPLAVAGSGRVATVVPPEVPRQDYWSWVGAPKDTVLWTNIVLEELRDRLRATTLDPVSIDIHAAEGSEGQPTSKDVGQWLRLDSRKSFSGQTLCRARVGLRAYRYFFAAISSGVITHEADIQPDQRARLRFGLDLLSGNRHRIRVHSKGDALKFELYRPLPSQELRLIHALTICYADGARHIIEVSRQYLAPIRESMRSLGVDLELRE